MGTILEDTLKRIADGLEEQNRILDDTLHGEIADVRAAVEGVGKELETLNGRLDHFARLGVKIEPSHTLLRLLQDLK